MSLLSRIVGFFVNRRHADRKPITKPAIAHVLGRHFEINVQDVTATGFRALTLEIVEPGTLLTIDMGLARRSPATVIWTEGSAIGCQFSHPLRPTELASVAGWSAVGPRGGWVRLASPARRGRVER